MLVTDHAVDSVLGVSHAELSEAMGRRWFHKTGALRPEATFGWNALNKALRYGNLGTDQVRLVGGDVATEELFHRAVAGGSRVYHRIAPQAVHRGLDSGGTLVIDQLDLVDPWADQVARALSGVFSARVQANVYASLRGAPGFGAHRDTHDVFVVQGSGRKHWTVAPGDGTDEVRLTMEPGDVLYLPEGTTHDVATHAQGSLHITFAVPRPNLQELLTWRAADSGGTFLRTAVDPSDPAAAAASVAQWAGRVVGEADIRRFLEDAVGGAMAPSCTNLPYACGDPSVLEGLSARRSFVCVLPDGATDHARVLARLTATDRTPVKELLAGVAVDDPVAVVGDLMRWGLIDVSET
ncbi:JmjC domain-containing protein [Streptomyces sp. NPDC054835]|uniref:JmjC domain-containing protein n=1 Tax=Streptomyces sp. NBC_01268 TaxID=2903806 RepID=UPI002E349780|nr:cupin domain-containing protein [Streptomyces sp. NBC_01268]